LRRLSFPLTHRVGIARLRDSRNAPNSPVLIANSVIAT
jgi:hypothetical protein